MYNIGHVHFDITQACNLNCKYCFYYENDSIKTTDQDLSFDIIKRVINEIEELGTDTLNYTFSGGEVFLRDDFYDILDLVRHRKIKILTNGLLIKNSDILKLSYYDNIEEIRISFDGFNGNKKNRLINDSDYLWERIKTISDTKGIPISINTIITRHNYNELIDIYNSLKTLDSFYQWKIDMPFFRGRYTKTHDELYVSNEKIVSEIKKLLEIYKKDNMPFRIEVKNLFKPELINGKIIKFDANEHPCNYNIGSITIRGNGDVGFCPSLPLNFGNIKEQSIKEITQNTKFNDFINLKVSQISEKCLDCKYLELCGAGCRADSYLLTKSLNEIDRISCDILPYIETDILPIFMKGSV
ncbi:radical SAM protein [Caloranaerobacter sp. DY30410]|uniref:radical SAM protein n=1 Tax=Caloranaerobacter sp. DY30410 TaxID=3238305 RepID=UPI003D089C2A